MLFFLVLLLFKHNCLHFHSITSLPTPPIPTSHSHVHPLWLCPCVLHTCSLMALPLLSPIVSLPPSSLVTVKLFFISVSVIVFCLPVCFVDQVPLIGEIIWYLSLTTWLISLSIMLSSSIHAVPKGRSSFFLSTVYVPLCRCTTVF